MADWQVGDLALCIKVGAWTCDGFGPRMGETHVVTDLKINDEDGDLYLALEAFPRRGIFADWFYAARFVKVTPPAADEFDRETIALMNGAPVREDACLHMPAAASAPFQPSGNSGEQGRNALASGALIPFLHSSTDTQGAR